MENCHFNYNVHVHVWTQYNSSLIFQFSPLYRFTLNFVCVEVLQPSQPNGAMLSAVSLPNHMFTGQA